jgi:hypothetical protein
MAIHRWALGLHCTIECMAIVALLFFQEELGYPKGELSGAAAQSLLCGLFALELPALYVLLKRNASKQEFLLMSLVSFIYHSFLSVMMIIRYFMGWQLPSVTTSDFISLIIELVSHVPPAVLLGKALITLSNNKHQV